MAKKRGAFYANPRRMRKRKAKTPHKGALQMDNHPKGAFTFEKNTALFIYLYKMPQLLILEYCGVFLYTRKFYFSPGCRSPPHSLFF